MKVSITELEELRENLRKAWFYANKAAEIGEEGYIAEEILDEIQEAVDQIRYANMAVDAEVDQEEGYEAEQVIERNKRETEKLTYDELANKWGTHGLEEETDPEDRTKCDYEEEHNRDTDYWD